MEIYNAISSEADKEKLLKTTIVNGQKVNQSFRWGSQGGSSSPEQSAVGSPPCLGGTST